MKTLFKPAGKEKNGLLKKGKPVENFLKTEKLFSTFFQQPLFEKFVEKILSSALKTVEKVLITF